MICNAREQSIPHPLPSVSGLSITQASIPEHRFGVAHLFFDANKGFMFWINFFFFFFFLILGQDLIIRPRLSWFYLARVIKAQK